jgi:hypothetical protein
VPATLRPPWRWFFVWRKQTSLLEVTVANLDKDKSQTNPSSVFDKPADVVANKELKLDEKAKVLQEWELDARLMDVAVDEGMEKKDEKGDSKPAPTLLPEIKKAQKDLDWTRFPTRGRQPSSLLNC